MQDTVDSHTALLILACAGAINQQYLQLIDLQNAQIKILKRMVGKRPKLNDLERAMLARMAHDLDQHILTLAETIVTPQTLKNWYRRLIAKKYDGSKRRGRPAIDRRTEELIVKLATENPTWGEDAIADRLQNLGMRINDRTVGRILRRNGIPPAPEREPTGDWHRFLTNNWPDIAAIDFTTIEVVKPNGTLIRHHAWYAIHLATRVVQLVGISPSPNGEWTTNMARKLTDFDDGFLRDKKFVIMDRDRLYCESFRNALQGAGVKPIQLPARSPNLNAYMERFMGTVKREICDAIIPRSSTHLRQMLSEHVEYYNGERNHQGLDGHAIPSPDERTRNKGDRIVKSSRLGGMLNFYHRSAA